jgi:hypothetical protein
MAQREYKFQLIGNRFNAVIAACLTGFLAARDLRAVFSGASHKSGWLIPLDSLPLPIWAVITLNLFFYIYMLWLGYWGYRATQGNERVVVGGFFTAALLGLLGSIKALGSPQALTAIRSVQALGMSVAFFAALLILFKSPAWQKGDAQTARRLLLFVGAFAVFVLVIGAVLYFTWR